jgi:hypothetical protein
MARTTTTDYEPPRIEERAAIEAPLVLVAASSSPNE